MHFERSDSPSWKMVVANFGRPAVGGPINDWRQARMGADFPEQNVKLRRDSAADVVSSFGIPGSVYTQVRRAQVSERAGDSGELPLNRGEP